MDDHKSPGIGLAMFNDSSGEDSYTNVLKIEMEILGVYIYVYYIYIYRIMFMYIIMYILLIYIIFTSCAGKLHTLSNKDPHIDTYQYSSW